MPLSKEQQQILAAELISAEKQLQDLIKKYDSNIPGLVLVTWIRAHRMAGYGHLCKDLLFNYEDQMRMPTPNAQRTLYVRHPKVTNMKDPVTISITVPQAYMRALANDLTYTIDTVINNFVPVYDKNTTEALVDAYEQLQDACNSTPVPTTDPDVFEDVGPDDNYDEGVLGCNEYVESTQLQDHHLPDETINVNEIEDACRD